jgi:hypothetical protein
MARKPHHNQRGGSISSPSHSHSHHASSAATSTSYNMISLLTVIIIAILLVAVIYLYTTRDSPHHHEHHSTTAPYTTPHNNSTHDPNHPNHLDINVNIQEQPVSFRQSLVNRAHDRIINPLLPPERSYEMAYGVPINMPTRSSIGSYQQIGHMYKTDVANSNVAIGQTGEPTILPLYGRPLYNGSRRWTYYTSTDKVNMIKLPVSIDGRKCDQDMGCNEIMSGDNIDLPPYNGKFSAEIYDYDKPRYIPYI